MSRVIVQFYGICTQVALEDGTHRVILPKAGSNQIEEQDVLSRQRLQPHVARLQIRKNDLSSHTSWDEHPPVETDDAWIWTLDGDTLCVEDPAKDQPPAGPDGGAFPRLNDYCCSPVKIRPEYLSSDVPAKWEHAACVFEFPGVTPVARRTPNGEPKYRATVGVIAVSTNVDNPVISLTHSPEVKILLTVENDAEITVYSYPEKSPEYGDKDADFLLHFLSAEIPAQSWFPPAPPWKECTEAIDTNNWPDTDPTSAFTGPGCSNSSYP